jgi:hypothetical protein
MINLSEERNVTSRYLIENAMMNSRCENMWIPTGSEYFRDGNLCRLSGN